MFTKILIANRGEIAVRLIRACQELGIATVAVYSAADVSALHVRMADEAYPIGPAEARQSYLNIPAILQAAQTSGAQAIHPGYGFLSENADFAQAVQNAGIVFIGPNPHAIRAMGSKAGARALMHTAGVPIVPGYQGEDQSDETLQSRSQAIGFPLLVKAAAGGGGKGMRVAQTFAELPEALASARREALHAFGDARLILERYIPNAHHIEIQILADQHGNTLHLFERECSVQRRHQKIIEEAPSPNLTPDLRHQIGAAAVAAARAVNYTNAGTVEFIFNPTDQTYYFLEMNTRLQVEHPITESITGLDLAQWQIRIAAGEPLPFTQSDLTPRGHAIECRLYAEDPANAFLPATGTLHRFIPPAAPGIRVDSGISDGSQITLHYDPMLAKLIVHAQDRPAAIRRMVYALQNTLVFGLTTNQRFLIDVLNHPEFLAGRAHTTWVERTFAGWQPPNCGVPPEILIAAALADLQTPGGSPANPAPAADDPYSPWRVSSSFRNGDSA
ncbi:MAG: hypothetical protein OHK0052_05670 [Anaerolineales bacterium]